MKATRLILTLAIATLLFCASVTTAYAQSYIAGNLYRVNVLSCDNPYSLGLPDATLVPPRSPDVTFLVRTSFNGIPLDFNDTYWQNGLNTEVWLTHSPNKAINVMGLSGIQYADLSDYPCSYVTLIDFTGQVTVFNGEVFTGDVDDNIWLEIDGYLVLQAVQPPGPVQGVYTGPSGTFPFRLIYIETNDVAARLKITHN